MTTEASLATADERIRSLISEIDQATLALNSANAQLDFLTEHIANGLDLKPEWFGSIRFSVFEDLLWSITERVEAARAALAGDAKGVTP
ncbi:MAG: hypothetical protein RLZZ200_2828 [Pseudomonadota bacterium]|jgi:multidrug resistance efflux pump